MYKIQCTGAHIGFKNVVVTEAPFSKQNNVKFRCLERWGKARLNKFVVTNGEVKNKHLYTNINTRRHPSCRDELIVWCLVFTYHWFFFLRFFPHRDLCEESTIKQQGFHIIVSNGSRRALLGCFSSFTSVITSISACMWGLSRSRLPAWSGVICMSVWIYMAAARRVFCFNQGPTRYVDRPSTALHRHIQYLGYACAVVFMCSRHCFVIALPHTNIASTPFMIIVCNCKHDMTAPKSSAVARLRR